jgi:hypothetical protein
MSTIIGLSTNTSNSGLSKNNTAAQTAASAAAKITAVSTNTKSLDSYIASKAVSLADYIGNDGEGGSSSLYSVLTYGQQGQLGLICNKVTGANGQLTKQSVSLADYLGNDTNRNNLYSVLTQDEAENKSAAKNVSLVDYLDK